ncbi:MAG: hypothetical protein ABEI75_00950 [Halobaculum sp.]
MGYTFDIGIWLTNDLDQNGDGDPRKALSRFVPENFEEAGHSVDLTIHTENPYPPAESVYADSDWPASDDPCPNFTGHETTFDNLLDWWDLWHPCNASETHADANVLVSNYESTAGYTGGDCDQTGNHYCVAEASNIGKLADESVDNAGSDLRYSQMYATVIHEIGHAVIDETGSYSCGGSTVEESRIGNSWTSNGNTYTTPMVTFDNGTDYNECCTDLVEDPGYYSRYYSRSYSQCAQDHLVNCANKY